MSGVSPSIDWRVTNGVPIVWGMPFVPHFCKAPLRQAPFRVLRRIAGAIALMLSVSVSLPAQADEQVTVVELFTSQGCPACVRADKLLGELVARDDILALSLHVDYWDYYGWADPFASEVYSQRQQRYLDKRGLPYVYTPQIVVDGQHQASGNKPKEVMANIRAAQDRTEGRVVVRVERVSGGEVRVRIPDVDARYRGEAEIVMVRFDEKHVTEVPRGENSGKTITNHHVVRMMRPVARWNGEQVDVVVPLQELDGADPVYCAIIVQERGQGRILGASVVDMRELSPRG